MQHRPHSVARIVTVATAFALLGCAGATASKRASRTRADRSEHRHRVACLREGCRHRHNRVVECLSDDMSMPRGRVDVAEAAIRVRVGDVLGVETTCVRGDLGADAVADATEALRWVAQALGYVVPASPTPCATLTRA